MAIWSKLKFPTQDVRKIGAFAFNLLKPPVKDIATIGRALPRVKTPFGAVRKTGEWAFSTLRKKAYEPTKRYFEPTEDVRLRDVARELPYTGIKMLKFGTTVREEMSKSGGSLGLSLHNIFADIKDPSGKSRITEFKPEKDAPKIEKSIHQFVFGKEPIKAVEQRIREGEKKAIELGVKKKYALPVSMVGVGAIISLDFTGFGGGKKTVVKMLAKMDDVADISKTLRQVGVADDLILPTAKKMKTITNAVEIEKAFDKIDLLQKSTKVTPKVARPADRLLETMKRPTKPVIKVEPKIIPKIARTKADKVLEIKRFKTEKIAEKATKAKDTIREIGKKEYRGFELPEENSFRYLQRQLQNKMNRLKITQEAVIKKGGKIDEASDAYLKQELYYGKAGNVIDKFDNDFVEPFLRKAKDKKISIDDLGEFLYAKHAPERNIQIAKINKKLPTGGSGMTDEQAKTIITKFEKQGKLKELENLADEFYESVTKKRLKLLGESGLEKSDLVTKLEEGYKNYIPLKGKEGVDRIGAVGQGFSVTGKDVRRAFGRGSRAKNPFVQSILDYQSTLIRNEKNKVAKSFLKLVEENPNPKIWEVEGLKYTPRYDKTGEIISLDPKYKFADNVLQVRVDGKIKLITIHDKVLADSMKNIGTERSIKLLYKVNDYLRGVNTIFNPEFLITNFQRDLQTALINVGGEQSAKMAKNTALNLPKAMKGIWRNVRKGDVTSEWAKTYQELKDMGGKTGFFDMKTIDEKVRQLEKNIKRYNSDKTTDKMSGFVKAIGDYVSDTNEVVEMAVRTSAYKEALANGFTKSKAASLAKNLTVNFNKKGNWGTMLNTFYLFANAGIQGSARVITALRYKGVRKIVGAITAGSFAINEMNRMINEEEYKKISDFNKNSNLIFMMPSGNHLKIKLPYGFNIFKIIGDIANESMHGEINTVEAGKRLIVALDDAYNPLSSPTVAQLISPTILDPIVQWSENKNWFGSPIKPSQLTFGAKKRESSLYWASVRPQTKAITEWLNKVTGGSEIEAGFVDISPENIDELVNFLGGGVGKFLSNSLATGISLGKGEFPKLKNIPFVRKVIQEPSEFWEKATIREIKEKSSIKELEKREIDKLKTAVRDGLKDEDIDEEEATKVIKEVLRNQARIKAGRVFSKIKNASSEEKKKAISELNELEKKEFIKIIKKSLE